MKLILAADENWGIGKDGGLLCHIPGDLKFFKEKTLGKVVVMGRVTLESLPGKKGLPGRTNIVLTRNKDYEAENATIVNSEEELFQKLKEYGDDEVMLIGGAELYNRYLPMCDTCYITKIYKSFDADRHFKNLDEMPDFKKTALDDIKEENGIRYQSFMYERIKYNMEKENMIIGRNPVIEALKSKRTIEKILIQKNAEGSIGKILAMAKESGVIVVRSEKKNMDRIAEGRPHQGCIAYVSAYKYAEMKDIYEKAERSGEEPFVIILDNLEDPHNLGAIMRTAECTGAHGIIVPKRRSCGLTEIVAKSSAGAIEYMPCVKVPNIARAIEDLQKDGFWVAACDMGGQDYYKANLTGKMAVVIGSEGFGISRLVKEKCDFTVSMPMRGNITSLNASNAAAVIMYEIRRQRDVSDVR